MNTDLDYIWKKTLAQIEVKLDSRKLFLTWFNNTRIVSLEDKTVVVGAPNAFSVDFLKRKYRKLIGDTVSYIYGVALKVDVVTDPECAKMAQDKKSKEENAYEAPMLDMKDGATKETQYYLKNSNINPKYSFTNFVVADSNRLAHAAAKSVAEKPGTINPLFIHGNTGLGKTHLAQSIARDLIEKNATAKVLYTTSENFLNDLIGAIRSQTTQRFREKYRQLDLLIIDDIQMISNWVETQSEFFNTFNALYSENKQVILISDRPPEAIAKLEERLKSRFQGGLVTDIKEPEYETRVSILEQKARSLNINLPSSNIRSIAQLVSTNVRELEGALQKVNLLVALTKDHAFSHEEIANILGKSNEQKRKNLNTSEVLRRVGMEFEIKISEIKSERRTKEIALARQICMYILREEYRYKLEAIAALLNRSDHTTIIHGVEKIREKIHQEPSFKIQLDKILADLAV